jgi:hypothetical protein
MWIIPRHAKESARHGRRPPQVLGRDRAYFNHLVSHVKVLKAAG